MLRQGLLNKQIAYDLGVGETTVKAHVSEILRKLKVSSRTQAVIEAAKIDFDAILAQTPRTIRAGAEAPGNSVLCASIAFAREMPHERAQLRRLDRLQSSSQSANRARVGDAWRMVRRDDDRWQRTRAPWPGAVWRRR